MTNFAIELRYKSSAFYRKKEIKAGQNPTEPDMTSLLKFCKTWWPTALTLGVVLYATLSPNPVGADEVMLFPGADKLIHAIMMGGLASAVLFDMRCAGHRLSRRRKFYVALAVFVFSFIDEFAQQAMELGRSPELADAIADTVGIIVASFTAPPVINHIFRHRPLKDN